MSSETAYDVVAYPSNPLPQAHPGLLGGIARLHGVPTALASKCRYLELGCGDGSHLIPLAYRFPESEFLGVDYAALPVNSANERVAKLGLKNVKFIQADVSQMPEEVGKDWDFVVAHGLFSWVPEPVRHAVLRCVQERLSPNGIAYISYNAYPGGKIREILWDLLKVQTRQLEAPQDKIRTARETVAFLLTAGKEHKGTYQALLVEEVDRAKDHRDNDLLFHDDLSENNQPYSILQFVEMAAPYGLQYLAEADFHESSPLSLPNSAREELARLADGDRIRQELLLDYARCRKFRQTILCRSELPLSEPSIELLEDLNVTGELKPDGQIDLTQGVKGGFTGSLGGAVQTDHAQTKRALLLLSNSHPNAVPVKELVDAATKDLPDAREQVLNILLKVVQAGLATIHSEPAAYLREPGEFPRVSLIVREEAEMGRVQVSSLRHRPVALNNPVTIQMVQLLDGTRSRAELLAALREWLYEHAPPGQAPSEEQLPGLLDEGLRAISSHSLMEA